MQPTTVHEGNVLYTMVRYAAAGRAEILHGTSSILPVYNHSCFYAKCGTGGGIAEALPLLLEEPIK